MVWNLYICKHNKNACVSYRINTNAKVAQLVEHDLAKVGVASSNLVFRSIEKPSVRKAFFYWLFFS
jgi:hypothetical protein